MIPRPAVEALLQRHGNTAEGRRVARREMHRIVMGQAAAEAAAAGKSMRCARDDCARMSRGVREGCLNDGSRCICECHDPEEKP